MRLEADLHTHTLASGHGYSTVKEMAEAASAAGLKMLAITDHGLSMPGAPHYYHFTNTINWPRYMAGVEVLKGVEANIIDTNGRLDTPEEVLKYLDLVLAGFHSETWYNGKTVEDNTRAMIAAIRNPYVHIIVHPGNPMYPVDLEKVVLAARSYGKALELNNNSFLVRPGSSPRCYRLAKLARRHGVAVSINSDAHICYKVGDFETAVSMAQEAGIQSSQVLNSSAEEVRQFLARHKLNRESGVMTN
ncbi:MAG: phosphatase [Firmicutes bacterium]|nr:phosphatase [Bacillota bacterium]